MWWDYSHLTSDLYKADFCLENSHPWLAPQPEKRAGGTKLNQLTQGSSVCTAGKGRAPTCFNNCFSSHYQLAFFSLLHLS